MTVASRVATRWKAANVVPFRGRPRGPQVAIGSRKYVLSDYWPMGTAGDGEAPAAGARVIDVGGDKFRWLWAYDTDKQVLAMWRYTDGDEKHYENAHRAAQHIHKLEKRGQLNRVTNAEFRIIEREMSRRYEDVIKTLREHARSLGGDWQEQVNAIARDFFDHKVRPLIERALSDAARGAVPMGFRFNERIPQSRDQQIRAHIVSQMVHQRFNERLIEDTMRTQGLDPEMRGVDNQAAYWAVSELRQDVYEEYLR